MKLELDLHVRETNELEKAVAKELNLPANSGEKELAKFEQLLGKGEAYEDS